MPLDTTTILLLIPIGLLQLGLQIFGIVDLIRRKRTRGPKWLWALVIVCGSILGAVLYLAVGRDTAHGDEE